MIDTKPTVRIERGQEFTEKEFRISDENVAHILGILRNQLYSDKIGAVVREYICNALDAQADSEWPDKKVVVGCPTVLSPYFTVRDYGPGMSQDTIFNLFTSYGDSTKRNSNEYVGMYGIGSKSAFAYTDSFNVISYCEGKKTTYVCYIDESHKGKVALLQEEDSDELSGLEINVPVKVGDFAAYAAKIQWVSNWAQTEFDVVGFKLMEFQWETHFQGNNWVLLATKHSTWFSVTDRHLVVMGHVAYPFTSVNIPEVQHFLQRTNVVLKVDIGAIDISASREHPQFTKKTVQVLAEAIKVLIAELKVMCEKELAEAKCYYHACQLWAQPKYQYLQEVFTHARTTAPKYKDRSLMTSTGLQTFKNLVPNLTLRKFYLQNGKLMEETKGHWRYRDSINFAMPIFIAYGDLSKVLLRTKHYMTTSGKHYNFNRYRGEGLAQMFTVPTGDTAGYQVLLQELEGCGVVELKDVEPPVITKTPTATVNSRFNPKVAGYKWNWDKGDWEEVDVELQTTEQRIYLPINRFYAVPAHCPEFRWTADMYADSNTPTNVKKLLACTLQRWCDLQKIDFKTVEVYGIKVAHLDKLQGPWARYDKWLKDQIIEYMTKDPQLGGKFAMAFNGGFNYQRLNQEIPLHKYLDANHPVAVASREIAAIGETRKLEWLRNLICRDIKDIEYLIPKTETLELWKQVIKPYPLLNMFVYGHYARANELDGFAKHMCVYIKAMDRIIHERLMNTSPKYRSAQNAGKEVEILFAPQGEDDEKLLPTD